MVFHLHRVCQGRPSLLFRASCCAVTQFQWLSWVQSVLFCDLLVLALLCPVGCIEEICSPFLQWSPSVLHLKKDFRLRKSWETSSCRLTRWVVLTLMPWSPCLWNGDCAERLLLVGITVYRMQSTWGLVCRHQIAKASCCWLVRSWTWRALTKMGKKCGWQQNGANQWGLLIDSCKEQGHSGFSLKIGRWQSVSKQLMSHWTWDEINSIIN